jgi:tetratricopeptide (TPR) repeat protein
MTAADKYYLKAEENYPFNLEEALEALEYGLSTDDMHPGLLTLKGRIYHRNLRQFDLARECFETALYSDSLYVDTYYAYMYLLLWLNELEKAGRLIARALKVPGIDRPQVLYFKAIMHEKQGEFQVAAGCLREAAQYSLSKQCYKFYTGEIERVRAKDKDLEAQKAPVNIILVE